MTTYAYVVKDKGGKTHSGTMDTDSRNALLEQLWKQELVVLSIEERHSTKPAFLGGAGRVTSDALVVFSRQLATMVESGIPIVSALDILAEQTEDRALQHTLRRIQQDVEAGSSLSEGLGRHPKIFSAFFTNMVRAGESSGRLDEMLDRLAAYIEKTTSLQRKVRASLFYPAFVSVLAFSITAFLVIVIVPQFKEIFKALGGTLPLPTLILLAISDLARRYLVAELLAMIAGIAAFRLYLGTSAGRLWFDQLCLRVPVVGKLLQKVAIARFSRTLATLVKSGVPILGAMEIVAKTSGNMVIERAVMSARASVREGESIAEPLARSRVFPPMVTRMIGIGEKTGELEKMLTKIADFYENEVDAAISGLTSLIEPLVISVLGVVIGGVVIALFLPIFKITTLIAR